MSDGYSPNSPEEVLRKGRRIFNQLAFGSLALGLGVTTEEFVTWNIPGFAFGMAGMVVVLGLHWWLVWKGFSFRWLLFGMLLVVGAYTFLLGGLHMKEFQTEPVDPLCYWLAAAGLAFLGTAGYTTYGSELDVYFRTLRTKREAATKGS